MQTCMIVWFYGVRAFLDRRHFRIGYWMLFIFIITCFKLTYSFWRNTLYVFHTVIVICSTSMFLHIYIFVFEDVSAY